MHDLACVIHLHSIHSDGTGTVRQIMRAGRRAEVDVVVLTDHDTLAAKRDGHEGWHDGVLLLVGEEVSPPRRDHCLALGVDDEIDNRLAPEEFLKAIRMAGGLSFAAHPFSQGSRRFKRAGDGMPFAALESDALDGIELWSFVTDTAETFESLRDALRFIVSPGRVVDHPPERNLREWDRLCGTRRVVAIGGLDAHQIGKRIGPVVPLRLMAYHRSFRHLRTHVLCEEAPTHELDHDRSRCTRRCVRGAATWRWTHWARPKGFEFDAAGPAGDLRWAPRRRPRAHASSARAGARADAAPARRRGDRDGGRGHRAEREVSEPGVYRVEVERPAHRRLRTWILSNPIYLR